MAVIQLGSPAQAGYQDPSEWALERELTRRCMTAKGFKYFIPASQARPPYNGGQVEYGDQVDLARRRIDGYGLFAATTHGLVPTDDPQGRYVATLGPADHSRYMEALIGKQSEYRVINSVGYPARGCVARSRRTVYGNLEKHTQLTSEPQFLYQEVAYRVRGSNEYQEAVRRWSKCMAGRQMQYPSPSKALGAIRHEYDRTGPTAETHVREIAVAVADGECTKQSHLERTFAKVLTENATKLSAKSERLALSLAEFRIEVRRRVAKLLPQISKAPN